MKFTIGVAVSNLETAIKSGTLWCPSKEENFLKRHQKGETKHLKHLIKAVPAQAAFCQKRIGF
jgi:hypothetical protein